MKMNPATHWPKQIFFLLFNVISMSVLAVEPQTLFNFSVSPGTVTASLVAGSDGNFYGTTTHGGPEGSGTIFRVTPAGVLTTLVADQANPAAGVVAGPDGLLYGLTGAGGAFGFGTALLRFDEGFFFYVFS